MNIAQIVAEAARRGLRIEARRGNLVVSAIGCKPAALLEAIRAKKAEIIAALQGNGVQTCEESETGDESPGHDLQLPPSNLPLPQTVLELGVIEPMRLIDQVIAQGKPAVGWCLARANQYYQRFPESSFEDQDAAAAWDLLRWQGAGSIARRK